MGEAFAGPLVLPFLFTPPFSPPSPLAGTNGRSRRSKPCIRTFLLPLSAGTNGRRRSAPRLCSARADAAVGDAGRITTPRVHAQLGECGTDEVWHHRSVDPPDEYEHAEVWINQLYGLPAPRPHLLKV